MSFKQSKSTVDELYRSLSPIADDIVRTASKNIDIIINEIKAKIDNLSNKEICFYMLRLGIEAYNFGVLKDKAGMKQACADAIHKEEYATEYGISTGTVASRQQEVVMNTTHSKAVVILYDVVSNLMKTKLDETHRFINILTNIQITRNAEAKIDVVRREKDNAESRKDVENVECN